MAKPLTRAEAQQAINALVAQSILFIMVEFRGWKPEKIKYTSKKNGQAAEFDRLVFNVESQAESATPIQLTLPIPEGYEFDGVTVHKKGLPEVYSPCVNKGDFILAVIETADVKNGMCSFRGRSFQVVDKK